MARKARSAAGRSPAICADCALSNNVSGSPGVSRTASSAERRASF